MTDLDKLAEMVGEFRKREGEPREDEINRRIDEKFASRAALAEVAPELIAVAQAAKGGHAPTCSPDDRGVDDRGRICKLCWELVALDVKLAEALGD